MNLNASAYGATTLCVAVPSRHYFTTSSEFPLAGLRVAVKDMFHLRGVRTTCGNRAYADLYSNQDVTSATVQKLIDQGAIIVGKTKTAEFGGSQEVIGDWSDFSYAFNPRADGYLRCTGSSTGSASGITSYPWLDVGLGSDGKMICLLGLTDLLTSTQLVAVCVILPSTMASLGFDHPMMNLRKQIRRYLARGSLPLWRKKTSDSLCRQFHRSGHFARDMEKMIAFTRHGLNLNSSHERVRVTVSKSELRN